MPIKREEYSNHLRTAYLFASLSASIPAQEMVDMLSRSEAIAPLLDPTLWREKGKAASEDKELLHALAAFQERVRKLKTNSEQELDS